MDYDLKATIIFIGIFIWIIYFFVFTILNGKFGLIWWTVIGIVTSLIAILVNYTR